MVRKVKVEIGRKEEARKELLGAAGSIDEGKDVRLEKIVFESYEAFRKILTPERLRMLHVIREKRPKSIYELARMLGRDRRNVVRDLEVLEMAGFVELVKVVRGRRRKRVPKVPYDEIEVSISVLEKSAGSTSASEQSAKPSDNFCRV